MKRCVRERFSRMKAVPILICFALSCAFSTSTATFADERSAGVPQLKQAPTSEKPGGAQPIKPTSTGDRPAAGALPIKATGHVKSVSVKDRTLNIDGQVYSLSDELVIKDKKGRVMEGFALQYFITVDLVEYIRTDRVITEIKIIRHTS